MFNKVKPVEIIPQITEKRLSLNQAIDFIHEAAITQSNNEETLLMFQEAAAGNLECVAKIKQYIKDILEREKVIVKDMNTSEVVEKVYNILWGLGKIQDLYYDDEIDEIRINPSGRVFVSRRGKNLPTTIKLSHKEVKNLIERLIPYTDRGSTLNESSPKLELVRHDGMRITALCSPIVNGYGLAIRKHGNILLSAETLMQMKTMDDTIWEILKILIKGRRNIIISGGVNSGKTTLLKLLIGEFSPNLSIRVLDLDNELHVSKLYPERDIWELEAHPEIDVDMNSLFISILRLTPDVIVVGEFRGIGEAREAIRACTRGHTGLATAHFSEPEEVVQGTAMMMLEEGMSLDLHNARLRVAQAFQFVVQMLSDTSRGIKKVVSITEILVENNEIKYRTIAEWRPTGEDYLAEGEWVIVNPLSEKCIKGMKVYNVTEEDLRNIFAKE
jgi:pilus assembly protein CpaF